MLQFLPLCRFPLFGCSSAVRSGRCVNCTRNKLLQRSQKRRFQIRHEPYYSTTTTAMMQSENAGLSSTRDVKIVEVGPRDGLQNEKIIVNVQDKVQFIQLLQEAGCSTIEIGSFVSTKAIPTMSNTKQVVQELSLLHQEQQTRGGDMNNVATTGSTTTTTTQSSTTFVVLVPTIKYLHDSLQVLPTPSTESTHQYEIAIFASASETFSQKNLNCSISESMIRYQEILNYTKDISIPVRGYLSCVLGCPYEGVIASKVVGQLTEQLLNIGCYEVALSDTIGVGNRTTTKQMIYDTCAIATGGQSSNLLAVHFHDTYGQALNNILVALDFDIRTIDSSVAGLGGCPYAKGATGNVATEDLVYMLHGLGLTTGIDLHKLTDASEYICNVLGRPSNSKAGIAIMAKRQQDSK